MKKKIVDLVDQYKAKEARIANLETLVHTKNLIDYTISAWTEEDGETGTESFPIGSEDKRLKVFLKGEIQLEKKSLSKLGQKIAVEFGP